jgi:ribosomal protein S18 acetylase RimI-like enzyme
MIVSNSMALKTDLLILHCGSAVTDRGDYICVRTPDNPGYFWGNFIVMKDPPKVGDCEQWIDIFQNEFQAYPEVKHCTFTWDRSDGILGAADEFESRGFHRDTSVVMTAGPSEMRRGGVLDCPNLVIRRLTSESDWEQALRNQVACRLLSFNEELYLPFKTKQMHNYRKMAESGLGFWFGAFVGHQLVADCGVFVFDGLGRFQSVGTHPDFRRRGICRELVFQSSLIAFDEKRAKQVVIVADPDEPAAKIYESVGFKAAELAVGLCRYPPE